MSEKQITTAPRHHQLTNVNVWTPDGEWIAYDVRPSGASFTGQTVERVNVRSGEVEILYRAEAGAHVGVITASPVMPLRYVCIHGPENPDDRWQYDFHHRRGVIIQQGVAKNLDACDITPPFTPGALRGGSHVHVFSPDGSRLSFTYNDHVMHEWDKAQDLRNVGVAVPLRAVHPPKSHPREYDGSHFCVLVSRTTAVPKPGSDEINRAYEEGWVGHQGYRTDDRQQRWALAFIGDTLSADGEKIPEVFIVDLPESDAAFAVAGAQPLQGTSASLPAPPKGVQQRRLTFTHAQRFPGLVSTPRHWLRSAPDGSAIAFLMKDDNGVVQLWTVSPLGGEPHQVTRDAHGIQSAFSWHPDGSRIAFIWDNSVTVCTLATGALRRITPRSEAAPLADAVVFSPDGTEVAFLRHHDGYQQIFTASVS